MTMKETLKIGKVSRVHIYEPENKDIKEIIEKYNLHEIVEQDLEDENIQDKIDVYDDFIFLVLHFPKYNQKTQRYFSNELKVIMWKDTIISITKYETNNIDKMKSDYQKELEEDKWNTLKVSPYYILYIIIDLMYDKTLTALWKFNADLIKIENNAFQNDDINPNSLKNLLKKKRNAIFLKHMISPQNEILEELQKATLNMYKWDLDVYFEDLQYKSDKILATVDMVAENTDSVYDIYHTLTNIRTNTIISILTIFTAIIWIMTLVSGIFGMNVWLPLAQSTNGFSIIMWVMILIWAGMMFLFKKMKWL